MCEVAHEQLIAKACGRALRYRRDCVTPTEGIAGERRTQSAQCPMLTAARLLLAGCGIRQDMQDQPKYMPLGRSTFFADGRSARPLSREPSLADNFARTPCSTPARSATSRPTVFPFPITRAVLERGQERFNIYCAPCHDRLGNGLGMIVRRGFRRPPSYHSDRLRQVPAGYFYDVISNGFGAMPDYSAQIEPARPLGDRRLYPRAAIQPERQCRRAVAGGACATARCDAERPANSRRSEEMRTVRDRPVALRDYARAWPRPRPHTA